MIRPLLFLLFCPVLLCAQDFTSYFTGNNNDSESNALGGFCLMGGATEDDQAMVWFLEKANGGDVLILRTSGSDGYNDYFYNELNVNLNSVETLVFHHPNASNNAYVLSRINQAEAIWVAGGDQWDYISYWRNSPIAAAINDGIANRNIVMGGTSAGMAIMGQYYFSAQNGSATSEMALNNPFHPFVTVDGASFLENEILAQTITDTHFDNPERKGRLTSFLARIHTDYGVFGKAIACDEYTAVCIEPNGLARVFGGFPNYDDNAYFIQTNCELINPSPENISPNSPLTWNHNGQALKVYQVKGTADGTNTFDLNLWETGNGGEWMHWSVENGVFFESSGTPINCEALSHQVVLKEKIQGFPNPTQGKFILKLEDLNELPFEIQVYTMMGQEIKNIRFENFYPEIRVDLTPLQTGSYWVLFKNAHTTIPFKVVLQN
jgi:cyanophycinase-like exopeptidase